ncbi:MAG: hypothetical protein FJ125_05855 [Deltaproteobacteria bacterium]|nr:hypothetical protein [Deltaproteobacteria bacterium]
MEEASQAVAAGITPSFADLTISRLSQERRFYKFLEDFTYLKQTDRSDSTPDARGQMVGEDLVLRDPENRADLWSSCRMGSPFDFVDVAQINADASCPPVGIAQSGVFVRSGVSDAQARRGEWLVLGGDVERLAGYRFDLQNRTGRRQRALLLVEGTGPAAAALEAAAYLPGTAAPFCHAERLDRRFECTHETGDPALAANGTTVVLIANNQTAADPARIRMALTWRMLPVALQKISGDEPLQEGPPGSALPLPLVVEARDASGVPMGGASVAFRVTSGGGTVAPAAAATDPATGRAQTTLTLGPEPGESTVQAEARDVLGRNVGVVSFRALATGQACGPTAACDPACPDGYTCCRQADCAHLEECPGECVLLASDPRNCGCCGQRCEALNLAGGPQAACCGGRCAMQPRLDQTTDPVSVRYAACCGRARLDELCVTQKAAIFGYSHDGYFLAEAYCPAGQELVKVDLATDARNCGSCGNDCGPISCCLGWCADLQTDIGNCGRCFNRCPGPAPLCCHGQCMQLSSEPAHCLGCDVPCSDGFRCVAQYGCLPADQPPPEPRACQPDEITCGALCYPRLGAFHCGSCEQTCLSSFQACYEDTCVEPMNFDSAHCLAGGGDWVNYSGACPAGTECCFGSCYTAAELEALGSCGGCLRYCKMGEACCGGRCVNTKFDDRHCNACSTSCPAGRTCCAGACVDTQTDEGSCGGCLKRCLPGQQCCAGRCHDAASAPPGCE